MTAEKCIAILKEIEKEKGGSVLKLEKHQQEMMVDMYQLGGFAYFRDENPMMAGKLFDASDVIIGMLE